MPRTRRGGPKRIKLGSIHITGPSEAEVGTELEFTATVEPKEFTDVEVSWQVEGPETMRAALSVEQSFTMTPQEEGEYTISATAEGPEGETVEATHPLSVTAPEPCDEPPAEDEEEECIDNSADNSPSDNGDDEHNDDAAPPADDNPPHNDTAEGGKVTELSLVTRTMERLPSQGFAVIGAGDLTGDGVPDLVAGGPDTPRIVLFEGRLDGTFTERVTVSAGLSPEQLVIADFTGNRLGDILAISWSAGRANLLQSTGAFELSSPTAVDLPDLAWGAWTTSLGNNPGSALVWVTERGPSVWSFRQGKPSVGELSFPLPSDELYSWIELEGSVGLVSYERSTRQLSISSAGGEEYELYSLPSGVSFHALASAPNPQGGGLTLLGLDQLGRLHSLWFTRNDR